ncbi:hypothetical protein A3F56_03875 [Candidatus Kaiserbacteria bacterium RIFCSPHIGHO2_12_FULL_55_13]|nr:MAG: hypothetical protein A3F56_03875 [Candidatus Kaiserbacteria bacterium RIFCSPHIGHO2_12_FULL_55_13]
MRILGIETSCDETAVCLIEADGAFEADLPRRSESKAGFRYKVLGNGLLSQAALHAQYGGVFPNLAKREHAKNLVPLLYKALEEAGILLPNTMPAAGAALVPLKQMLEREPELFALIVPFLLKFQKPDIDAIAVTAGPGLEPALWVGINFAKALSAVWDIPLVAVNHMEGHIVLSLMDTRGTDIHSNILQNIRMSGRLAKFEFPLLALLISGGHTELVLSKQFGVYKLIGETRDDAAGEAFDKVARLMDLGYPGGPLISGPPGTKREMTGELKKQVAREFEECIADVLVAKTLRAVEEHDVRAVVMGGGVSANTYIRERLAEALEKADASAEHLVPPPELATDNALMIALAGYFHALKEDFVAAENLNARGNLKLS